MENIDMVHFQAAQAAIHGIRNGLRDSVEILWRDADLCANGNARGLPGPHDAAEVRFRHSVAILDSRIEVVDAGIQRQADRPVLIGG